LPALARKARAQKARRLRWCGQPLPCLPPSPHRCAPLPVCK
jgi:hypothetical protein